MTDTGAGMNRLRWRCTHRALREMDLLLEEFLDNRYAALTPRQAEVFADLAEMEDHDLWPLITGSRESGDPEKAEILVMLRKVRMK